MAMRQTASVTMQLTTQVRIVQTAGIPNTQIPTAVVGSSAMTTSSMIREIPTGEWAWGELERM
jgi:hypothetical protein